MLELLSPGKGIGRTGFDAQAAKSAHAQVVDVPADDAFLFAVGQFNLILDDFDGTVGAVGFTDGAAGAAMLVLIVMGHDHFALVTVEHLKGFPVFRILLCNDLSGAEEVTGGNF